MTSLFDYLVGMEPEPGDDAVGAGFVALIFSMAATGVCGVTTGGEIPVDGVRPGENWEDGYLADQTGYQGLVLPGLTLLGTLEQRPAGLVALPGFVGEATEAGWRPAVGAVALTALAAEAIGRTAVPGLGVLPPLFALGRSGATGEARLPALGPLVADSGTARAGQAQIAAPIPLVVGFCCELRQPVANRTPSREVVRLLCRNEPVLLEAAAELCGDLEADDDKAARVLARVSGDFVYQPDPDSTGVGDGWMCAAASWFLGRGDCEDGAVLIQALLLAAGVAPHRLVTIFGRVGLDRIGHAFTCYRRLSDGAWTVLDWTVGPYPEAAGPAGLPSLAQARDYLLADYALTAEAFFEVRRATADFLSLQEASGLALPGLVCAGRTNVRAEARLTLFRTSILWNSLACLGRCGAKSAPAMAAPGLRLAALVGARNASGGLPGLRAESRAGARGAGQAAGLRIAAREAARAGAILSLARLAAFASGLVRAVLGADFRLPRPRLAARALAGERGRCAATGAPWRLVARGLGGARGSGFGVVAVPGANATARAAPRAALTAALPPWSGQGRGRADRDLYEEYFVMSGQGGGR